MAPKAKTCPLYACRWTLQFLTLLGFLSGVAFGVDPDPQISQELSQELKNMDRIRSGRNTPLEKVDALGERLLAEHSRPEDHGQILYQMTHVYAQSGLKDPERTIALAKRALKNPVSLHQRMTLHVYCGDAIRASKSHGTFPEQRREAARTYLNALKEVTEMNLPATPPDLPVMELQEDPGVDPEEERRRMHEQMEKRKQIELIRQMIRHRDVLRQQVLTIYSRAPAAREELAGLANEFLGESPESTYLMAHVKEPKPRSAPVAQTEPPPPPESKSNYRLILIVINLVVVAVVLMVVLRKVLR